MVVEAGLKEKPDEVDAILAGKDGQIQRPRDPKMCHHNARQKCAHCLPIDPYDEEYLKSKEIKHLSFHSHIRKLTEGSGRGSQLKKPLENISCSIDLNCPGHKPYPKGVCTKCRPATVTLNRQRFRHVDNVMMENEELVNAFLDYWRRSGHQRVGYLIGTYQEFADVPLGMKATVVAIYEPPQTSSEDGVQLEEDKNSEIVDKMCGWLGLKRVGWIFTDLWSADKQAGTVHCTRHKDSFLLSASECITAADMQNKHPNPTVYCTDGYYGSKFVTVVASGDESMAINFHGYQVSNQCASLVAADLLCPTNHPELAYVREKPLNDTHYLTDVQFTEKNEYGAEVRRDGRPLPVEFLMVDVPAGMPLEKRHTFHVRSVSHAIENREVIGELQGGSNLSAYCAGFSTNEFLELATNFHFLIYLATNPIVKFSEEELRELCSAVLAQDRAKAVNWARDCGNWQTLAALANEQQHHAPTASSGSAAGGASHAWNCAHCTFENQEKRSDCAMCGLPATA